MTGLKAINRICEKYEEKATGKYGTQIAGRLLFALSRDVQGALEKAHQESSRREARVRELERVCDEWQTSFQDIARHTQGIFGIVPMTPAAVSTRLDEQQAQIQTLQAHIQRERREFDEARESFQAVLKMHQDASRRSAKDDISRFNEQVGMVMKKQSEALAEQRDARMKMQAETRQFLEEKDMKDREIESLRAQLSATAAENRDLKSEAERFDNVFDEAMQRARAECLTLLKRRELMWKHEFHSFQVEANASSEVDALRSSIVALRSQLSSLSFRYRNDTGALTKRLQEEQRVNATMREILPTTTKS